MLKRLFTVASVSLLFLSAGAQMSREEIISDNSYMSSVYRPYEAVEETPSPAPKDYEPFYISHYGRHGSRYLNFNYYPYLLEVFGKAEKAGILTPLGKDVHNRLKIAYEDANGRVGELTPLGNKQHYGIGRRMITNYPQVFNGNPEVTAKSTIVMRCAHSMFSFIEGLKSVNPGLSIPRESAQRNMYYLNNHSKAADKYRDKTSGPWVNEYARFSEKMLEKPAARIPATLFTDSLFIVREIDPRTFISDIYSIAIDLPDVPAGDEKGITLFDLFTPDELFDLWQRVNMSFYIVNSSYPISGGVRVDDAKNLLTDIVENADAYVASKKNGATLRFGHDTCITPLVTLMRLENCAPVEDDPYKVWEVFNDFNISPMGANLQIVFYKNKKKPADDVLVRLMLNEKEIAVPELTPVSGKFYRWNDLREHFEKMLATPSASFYKR